MAAIVLLKRNALDIHYSDLDKAISCPLPSSAVSDMEVTSEQELDALVNQCLANLPKRGAMQSALIVGDDLCFSVRLEGGLEEETKKMLISSSPFSRVATVTIKTPNGSIMTSTNQDLYETVARILETYGFSIAAVVPYATLPTIGISSASLDKAVIKRILDSLGSIKSTSFPYTPQAPAPTQPTEANPSPKPKKLPLWMIIFIGGALLYAMIMFFVFIR